jgi:hypothetical protein
MSHKATLWAIEQRGLKPTTKIVLWHLCDRFNPDFGCFPSQARLAQDCEISRSALNDHLDRLEAAKLLRRVPRVDPVTKRQMPSHVRNPDMGIGRLLVLRLSRKAATIRPTRLRKSDTEIRRKPCPDFAPSRVRKMPKAVSEIRTLTL